MRPELHAADAPGRESVVLPYGIVDPSIHVARLFQKRGDYTTAVLLYEAVLEQNPSDNQALKSMVECHEALARKERQPTPEAIQPPTQADGESLADLPELIPTDHANAQQHAKKLSNPVL